MTFEQQKNTKALAWTAGVHLALLLFFLLYKYALPVVVVPEDLGMEVNLGTSENSFGNDQPEISDDPAAAIAAVTASAASSNNNTEKEVETSEEPDAPAVNINRNNSRRRNNPQPVTHRTNNRSNTQSSSSAANNKPAQSPRYVYPGANGRGGNSAQGNRPGGNEGIGQGDGDMGVPGGTPGASNYSGVPGMGTSGDISTRRMSYNGGREAQYNEPGKVVIRVTVNREGEITRYDVKKFSNNKIREIALQRIKNIRFNKAATAPEEQFGYITFDFKATRR